MSIEKRFGATRIALGAGVAGALAGLAAIYATNGFDDNRAGGATCAAQTETIAALKPLAKGEVAAAVVRDRPQPLPALAFVDGEGRARSLEEWKGKVVLFNLWATWCVPCRKEMPALDRLQAALGGEAFAVVPVSIDRNSALAKKFLEEIKVPNLPLYADAPGQTFQSLKGVGKAFGMPTTLLIGRDGCELANLAGPAEWDSEDALALVRAALEKGS